MYVCRIATHIYTLVRNRKQNMQQHDERYIPQSPTGHDEYYIISRLNHCVSDGKFRINNLPLIILNNFQA